MSNVLTRICADKRAEVAARKAARPLAQVERDATAAAPPRGFAARLHATVAAGGYGLIAEVKKSSPSKGLIRADFDPPAIARAYERGGASCLSVLTDTPYFDGADDYLVAARAAVALPVLRKDFMVEPWQIWESRALGADCVLLILAALTDDEAHIMAEVATGLGMDILLEVHDEDELARALTLPETALLGINNRNLKTLETTLDTTIRLAGLVPKGRTLVAESGIHSHDDLVRMAAAGASCFLIGEGLMKQPDIEAATRAMLGLAAGQAVG